MFFHLKKILIKKIPNIFLVSWFRAFSVNLENRNTKSPLDKFISNILSEKNFENRSLVSVNPGLRWNRMDNFLTIWYDWNIILSKNHFVFSLYWWIINAFSIIRLPLSVNPGLRFLDSFEEMMIDDVTVMTHTSEYFFTNFRTSSFSSEKMKIIELVV